MLTPAKNIGVQSKYNFVHNAVFPAEYSLLKWKACNEEACKWFC